MKNPNKFRETVLPIVGIAVFAGILLATLTNISAFICLGGVALIAYCILSLFYWTCPKCKKMLPWYNGKLNCCPYCGHRFDNSES